MVGLWHSRVSLDSAHRQVQKVRVAIDADEDIGTTVAAKYSLMVRRRPIGFEIFFTAKITELVSIYAAKVA